MEREKTLIIIDSFNEQKVGDLDKDTAMASSALKMEIRGETPERAMQSMKDAIRAIASTVLREHNPDCQKDCIVFALATRLVRTMDEIDEEIKTLVAAKLAKKKE